MTLHLSREAPNPGRDTESSRTVRRTNHKPNEPNKRRARDYYSYSLRNRLRFVRLEISSRAGVFPRGLFHTLGVYRHISFCPSFEGFFLLHAASAGRAAGRADISPCLPQTGRGVNSQALSGLEIEVGGGLYPRGIIAADGDIEVVQKADFAQPPIDPAMR